MSRSSSPRSKSAKSPIKVLFVAGFGPIVQDLESAKKLYVDTLKIPFEEGPGGYLHTGQLDGTKHFALWPLTQASESCFGTDRWPAEVPIPQAWVEFDVEDIQRATDELKQRGYQLLVAGRKEPWGQTVSRILGPEGLLIGLTHTPWMRTTEP
jgi:hypothetical protein